MLDDIVQSFDKTRKLISKKLESNTDNIAMESLADPFDDRAETAFFATSNLNVQLDEVIHLCQFGGNVVTLLGHKGVGKTTFFAEARKELSETSFCCIIDSALMMTAEDVFKQIISQLELPVTPSSNTGEMLVALRKSMSDASLPRVVVIIDDADFLNESILSALLGLFQGVQGGQFHLLLSGDKNLIERLDELEIIDVLIYDIHLNPFSLEETKDYIDFKLSLADRSSEDYFKQAELDSIYKESKGFPFLINKAAQKLLHRIESIDDLGPIDVDRKTGLPLLHMGILIVLLAGLIMVLIYMGDGEPLDESSMTTTILEQPVPIEAKPDAIDLAIKKLNAERKADPTQKVELSASINDAKLVEKNTAIRAQGLGVNNSAANKKPTAQASEATINSSQVKVSNTQGTTVVQKSTIVDASRVDQSLNSEFKKELEREAQSLTLNKLSEPDQTRQNSKDANNEKAISQFTANEQAVLKWSDTRFTLQLIGAEQQASLVKFIDAQPNASQLFLVSLLRNGKPWHVVVTGVYDNTELARRAIQALPQNQVNGGPWPKKISDLQRDIQSFRRK
jgi:DamX protein